MATVALVLHRERPEARSLASDVADWLTARDHEVRLPREDAALIERPELGADDGSLADGCDLAIEPHTTRQYFLAIRTLVDAAFAARCPFEMLDRVGDVDLRGIDAR